MDDGNGVGGRGVVLCNAPVEPIQGSGGREALFCGEFVDVTQ